MKQTVEEVAREAAEDCYECHYDDSLEMRLVKEAFIYGAEWQSKQSPWISVKERLPEPNKLSFAEWYQMERLLVAISLFHPGDRHTLRQTEDLNLRIGTTTNVTCGCLSRLSMIYSKLTGMYWNELKRKEIEI